MEQPPISYVLEHPAGTVELVLYPDRLVIGSTGRGLLDRARRTDVALADLAAFAVVPTIAAQHVTLNRDPAGDAACAAYDAEFCVAFRTPGGTKTRRVFAARGDAVFGQLLAALVAARPDASLLGLDPADAQRRMGILSAARAVVIVVALLIGVPVLVSLLAVAASMLM